MKTMQFIDLPWAQLPRESVPVLLFPDTAQHLPQGALWQQGRERLLFQVDREGCKQRKTSASDIQVFVLQC